MQYQCEQCGASFPKLSQLKHHQRIENHWKKFYCDICGKWFTRKDNLDQHKKKHDDHSLHCDDCGQSFSRLFTLNRHKERTHQTGGCVKRPAENDPNTMVVKRLKNDDDPRQFYHLQKVKEQKIHKFRTKASTYKVNFKDIEVTEDVLSTLKRLFTALFEDLTHGSKSEDLVRLTIQSPSLYYPIVIPFLKIPELTADRFMAEIERVLQSNEDFVIDESLIIEVTLVDMPTGGVRKRCRFVNTEKFLHNKKCIIRIQNNDELCCARAIVTAKARIDEHEKWESIRKGGKLQTELAKQLHEQADVSVGKCGIDEIKKFQAVFPEYQIYVISREHFNGIIYSGPEAEKKIYLYHHNSHYDVITSMSAFLSRNYFCTKCKKGYDHPERHQCNNVCYAFRKIHDQSDAEWICCDACHRFFRGQTCFDLHRKCTTKGNSTCLKIHRCAQCGKTVNKTIDRKHVCGQTYCNTCKDFYPEDHQCYMLPEEIEETRPLSIDEGLIEGIESAKTYLYFDFECTQDDLLQCDKGYSADVFEKCQNCNKSNCGTYEHRPNLCVVQKVCTLCMDKESECDECGQREHVFSGDNTLDDFCQWLFSEDNYDSTALCHNFQGYDSYPILQCLYRNGIVPTIIPNGAKIMSLTVESCKNQND